MKFDLQRAFPYPVFRPDNNDYVDGDFQAETTFNINESTRGLRAEVTWDLSIREIQELIQMGKASFVLVISCRATFLRHVEIRNESPFHIDFEPGQLKDDIRVFSFVASREKINDFKCEWINAEWGESAFSFEPGALLAMDRPKEIFLDTDLTKKITSVFQLVKDESVEKYQWEVDANDDFVKIRVNPYMKEKIDIARNVKENKAILINSIYFSTVMQCVMLLKSDPDEYENYRWAKIMNYQIDSLSSLDKEEIVIAQDLLNSPLKKLETYVFSQEN